MTSSTRTSARFVLPVLVGSSVVLMAWGCGEDGDRGGSGGSGGGSTSNYERRHKQAEEACQGMLEVPCAHTLSACVGIFMRDAESPDYNFCSTAYDAYLECVKVKGWYCGSSNPPAAPAAECDAVRAPVDACMEARPCIAGIPINYLCGAQCSAYSVNCSLISTAEFECTCLGGAHDGAKYTIDDCKELFYADVGACAG